MPAPSLGEIARRVCIRNINNFESVGDVPWEFVQPIISRVTNPEQLVILEKNSPQLVGHTEGIWRGFVNRDISASIDRDIEPKNPASWFKVYKRLLKEEEELRRQQEEALAGTLAGIKAQQDASKTKQVGINSVKLPARRRIIRPASSSSGPLRVNGSGRTKVMTGKDFMKKARQDAREQSLFSSRNGMLAQPAHQLKTTSGKIRVPPNTLMNGRLLSTQLGRSAAAASRTQASPPRPGSQSSMLTQEERERRIRAIANKHPVTSKSSEPQVKRVQASTLRKRKMSFDNDRDETFGTGAGEWLDGQPRTSIEEVEKLKKSPLTLDRPSLQSDEKAVSPPATVKKRPVDIFMPQKKRKIAH